MLTTGSVIATKYRLDRMIARGGMGTVWCARHLLLDAEVAIKLMDPSIAASPPERARFAAEAKAAARLKSRHIVQVNDYGLEQDIPYIVMELLDGEDMGARLRREGRLSLQVAADLAAQIARGLRRAHEMGVVHRDLKPANVFLTTDEEGEVVAKILDFGIARFAVRTATMEMTRTGTLLGSPPYMSPEQVRGLKDLDHRTDLWSLGVILFRAVTGALPFQSEQVGDLIYKICAERVPRVSSFAAGLPPALDLFFERALAKNPADRFQSTGDMMEAFSTACRLGGRARMLSIPEAPSSSPQALAPRSFSPDPPAGPLAGRGMQKTIPIPGAATMPLAPPVANAPVAPPRGGATELGVPVPGALRTPQIEAGRTPLSDPGTLSTGGRTVGSARSAPRRRRPWWVIGLAGLATLVGLALIVRGSRSSEGAGLTSEPTAVTLLPSPSPPPPTPSLPGTGESPTGTGEPAVAGSSTGESVPGLPDPTSQVQAPAGKVPDVTGKLTVNTIPVSKVVVDGIPRGNTPRVGLVLPPGVHQVTLVNTATNQRYSTTVEIKTGQTAKVTKRF